MSFLFNSSVSNASKEVKNAANEARNLIGSNSDLRMHHPASLGATINSIRLTSDAVRDKIEKIDLDQVKLAACFSGAVSLGIVIQSTINQRKLSAAIEKIADSTERVATVLERMANANDAGGKGIPVQLLDFANLVASQHGTRIILAYHPSNFPQAGIQRVLSKSPREQWPHLQPGHCILAVFDDWQELVSRLIILRRNLDPNVAEPISIIFPATTQYILRNFCHFPGDVDPQNISFHGQTDSTGIPFTWLPGEMMMDVHSVYQSSGIHNIGFISEVMEPSIFWAFFTAMLAGFMLCLALCLIHTDPAGASIFGAFFLGLLIFSLSLWYDGKRVFIRRIRDSQGGLSINRSSELQRGVISDGSYSVDTETRISRPRVQKTLIKALHPALP
ncbi:hypothetical protein BDZ94DRAFT_1270542 [Collybia nuda]|uniref:Uncharacterized protein n=1 Tax=Collybia nuda TaxID=64659 RepID=A0A9P5XVG7_9AGAR|nr:hypothetical protein BDZ94DRAFT_1270542 [Collybia nuda]